MKLKFEYYLKKLASLAPGLVSRKRTVMLFPKPLRREKFEIKTSKGGKKFYDV